MELLARAVGTHELEPLDGDKVAAARGTVDDAVRALAEHGQRVHLGRLQPQRPRHGAKLVEVAAEG
jgi:hypothetical protein